MNTPSAATEPVSFEPWYKYGVALLVIEMAIAIAVSGYSLYITFHGLGGGTFSIDR